MVVIIKINIKISQARAPRSSKLEKTLLSKIEYKSSSAVELAGGQYRKPMYTL